MIDLVVEEEQRETRRIREFRGTALIRPPANGTKRGSRASLALANHASGLIGATALAVMAPWTRRIVVTTFSPTLIACTRSDVQIRSIAARTVGNPGPA